MPVREEVGGSGNNDVDRRMPDRWDGAKEWMIRTGVRSNKEAEVLSGFREAAR
jgi:hypothetical protein